VLTNQYWWRAFLVTVVLTVISVAIELVIGMAFAPLMHRTLVGRGLVRVIAFLYVKLFGAAVPGSDV
jgi:multiple sugar transport system permease protein